MKSKYLKPQWRTIWAAFVFTTLMASSFSSLGATATVQVVNNAFQPATTNINAGDQVTWNWPSGSFNHNTVSQTAGLWSSAVMSGPATFSHTFSSSGTFPYSCTIHGFTGSIVVAAVTPPNNPPTVSITNPAANAVFAAPASVTIQASASDPDAGGSVTNVQFRIGATILTNVVNAPYKAVTNLAAGSYTLSAIASDNLGSTATNTLTISVVTPLQVTLGTPQLSSTNLRFSYTANVGLSYIVQRSTDLVLSNWSTLFNGMAPSNPMVFVDTHATNNPAFYRVGRLPNP